MRTIEFFVLKGRDIMTKCNIYHEIILRQDIL